MLREVVIDTETTGLDPKTGHRITEIGGVELIDKRVTGKKFHSYINPEREISYEAQKITGLTYNFLKNKPKFHQIVDEFSRFILGAKIVAHNARFDIKFLNHELILAKKQSIDMIDVIDTLSIARKKFPGQRVNLDALCKKYKVSNNDRKLHGALKDAELLTRVYIQLSKTETQISLILNNDTHRGNKQSTELKPLMFKVVHPSELEKLSYKKFVSNIFKTK